MVQPKFRRTRFVCVSDTHNSYPKLPAGDVLIHAGDLTNQGSLAELTRAVQWLESAPFEAKIVVAGNHDVTLDRGFYDQYRSYFHNQDPQDDEACRALLAASSVHYLDHRPLVVDLTDPKGPCTRFKIFGSPYSPTHGLWAFGYGPDEADKLWEAIPLDTDIVVTHTPPKYHCDEHSERGSTGCEALRRALWRVRPRMHVCGHVHEGRGAETVYWDLMSSNVRYKETKTVRWEDTTVGTKKIFKVDLTGERGTVRLFDQESTEEPTNPLSNGRIPTLNRHSRPAFPDHEKATSKHQRVDRDVVTEDAPAMGLGGPQGSDRVDKHAVAGRTDRTDTCIVNAAYVGSNWPHRAGKKINKPVVVDVLLPLAG